MMKGRKAEVSCSVIHLYVVLRQLCHSPLCNWGWDSPCSFLVASSSGRSRRRRGWVSAKKWQKTPLPQLAATNPFLTIERPLRRCSQVFRYVGICLEMFRSSFAEMFKQSLWLILKGLFEKNWCNDLRLGYDNHYDSYLKICSYKLIKRLMYT